MKMTHPYGRKQRGTKEPVMKVKEKSEKAGLKLNIQNTEIMASGLIRGGRGVHVWELKDFKI